MWKREERRFKQYLYVGQTAFLNVSIVKLHSRKNTSSAKDTHGYTHTDTQHKYTVHMQKLTQRSPVLVETVGAVFRPRFRPRPFIL